MTTDTTLALADMQQALHDYAPDLYADDDALCTY